MRIEASTIKEYISKIPKERKTAFTQLLQTVEQNIPDGFEETLNYHMPSFVVPHSLYPSGYHVDPKLPLPFCSIASQKNFLAFYHSGIYAIPSLHDWFVEEYKKRVPSKIDMGKSCVRFKKLDQIPYDLIAELMTKLTVAEWIAVYEQNIAPQKK